MKSIKEHWKRLIPEHRDYTFIYSMAILWALVYYTFTPSATVNIVLDRIVIGLWLLSTVVGAGLALYGLFVKDNLLIERLGVIILFPTPLIYSAIQVSLISLAVFVPQYTEDDMWQVRIAMAVMGLWLFGFLNKRRRQLKNRVQELKTAPAAPIKEQED